MTLFMDHGGGEKQKMKAEDVLKLEVSYIYSDQHQLSPNDIHTLPRNMVMRVNKMTAKEQNALICYQILSSNSLKKCMEISPENF